MQIRVAYYTTRTTGIPTSPRRQKHVLPFTYRYTERMFTYIHLHSTYTCMNTDIIYALYTIGVYYSVESLFNELDGSWNKISLKDISLKTSTIVFTQNFLHKVYNVCLNNFYAK
jgi:hypothetical protein